MKQRLENIKQKCVKKHKLKYFRNEKYTDLM